MEKLTETISCITGGDIRKIIISKPAGKSVLYKKIVVDKKQNYFQAAKYTEKQVFHENIKPDALLDFLLGSIQNEFLQVNAWDEEKEHILLLSKKGKITYKTKKILREKPLTEASIAAWRSEDAALPGKRADESCANDGHNRRKNYFFSEGMSIPPLEDMGIFTKEGKVAASMYGKFRQINRFIEMIDDAVRDYPNEEIHIMDFGCGKSYLTFIMYYYFVEIKHKRVQIIGLDLKEDVIEKCRKAASKYGYDNLRFEVGDIDGFVPPFDVDMVVTLHACDTATDFALFNALQWKAKMIFSVPCCQHELNRQMKTEDLSLLTRYGIVKERIAALSTDAIRANLLEYCGYKTQLLEFVDFEHTPKNLLIRAVRKPVVPAAVREKYLTEVLNIRKQFHFEPTLYRLLCDAGKLSSS